MNNCLECKKLTGGLCEKCFKKQDNNYMNKQECCEKCNINGEKSCFPDCSCPCHQEPKASWKDEFDKKFNWKDCGNASFQENITRDCYRCGFGIKFCANCHNDHHIDNRDDCIKSFISHLLSSTKQQIVNEIVEEINLSFGCFRLEDWSGESEVESEIERLKNNLLTKIKSKYESK